MVVDHQRRLVEHRGVLRSEVTRKLRFEGAGREIRNLVMMQMDPELDVFVTDLLRQVVKVNDPIEQAIIRRALMRAALQTESDDILAPDRADNVVRQMLRIRHKLSERRLFDELFVLADVSDSNGHAIPRLVPPWPPDRYN
ncbi:hypothetical protein [Pandoraea oxalativorans]|uniref:hypothetical protein n=1 Tax=Pandoraea oxalativorans TaxID=573737 RepID=UPI001FE1D0CB|nr:hypothetical protein [Pandoraea oxalativorans]